MTFTERAAWTIILALLFGFIFYRVAMGENVPVQIQGGCY